LRHIVLTALLDVFQLRSEAALNPLKYQFRGEKVVGGSRYVKLLPLFQIIIIWKERKRMSSNSVLFLRKLFRGHSFKRLFSARRKIFQTYVEMKSETTISRREANYLFRYDQILTQGN